MEGKRGGVGVDGEFDTEKGDTVVCERERQVERPGESNAVTHEISDEGADEFSYERAIETTDEGSYETTYQQSDYEPAIESTYQSTVDDRTNVQSDGFSYETAL